MRTFAALLLSLACCHGQSYYTNVLWRGETQNAPFETNVTFSVSENTLCEVQSFIHSSNAAPASVIKYTTPQGTFSINAGLPVVNGNNKILGPCQLSIQIIAYPDSLNTNAVFSASAGALLKLTPVNVTPGNIGAALPPWASARVSLETSSNLTEWATAAEITNTAGAVYEFYRVKIH